MIEGIFGSTFLVFSLNLWHKTGGCVGIKGETSDPALTKYKKATTGNVLSQKIMINTFIIQQKIVITSQKFNCALRWGKWAPNWEH